MLPHKHGAILLTGASAGVKGYPQSAPFAMGKFALRGLAQSWRASCTRRASMSRISSSMAASAPRAAPMTGRDSLLDPDAIAETYWHVMHQHRSAWSWEVEVRPWVERFRSTPFVTCRPALPGVAALGATRTRALGGAAVPSSAAAPGRSRRR